MTDQLNFAMHKSGWNRAFYGHLSSHVFLTNILKIQAGSQVTMEALHK